jgi:hypothetical protein
MASLSSFIEPYENNNITKNYLLLSNYINKIPDKKINTNSFDVHFFMFYYNEPIEEIYNIYYRVIDFIKLVPQTKYFEGDGFRKINYIPDKRYISILTPSITKKTKLTVNNIIDKIEYHNEDIIPLYYNGTNVIDQAIYFHGEKFRIIWNWLLKQINVSPNIKIPSFYSNLWIIKRIYFIEYLNFVKRIIEILESAPPEIEILLKSDCMYKGKVSPEQLLKNTGFSYYTYYPFIIERVICLFTVIKNLSVGKL